MSVDNRKIGGYFESSQIPKEKNGFFEELTPAEGSLAFLMSGRCGILCALRDYMPQDEKRVAYVPAYTCTTVLAPYVKAGYRLKFYEIDRSMTPVYDEKALDEISVINLCGYYGFSKYDRDFIRKCKEHGICILQDTTHSILSSDGVDPNSDYVTGSLRKWIGVPSGGFLIKRKGQIKVPLLPYHEEHLQMRRSAMDLKRRDTEHPGTVPEEELKQAASTFREAEMLLRQMFDCYESDPESVEIMTHFPVKQQQDLRRRNYQRIDSLFPKSEKCRPVFKRLDAETVPSHFTVLADQRDDLKLFLEEKGIYTTAYWPKSPLTDLSGCPEAAYIYDHVLSFPCDQRYNEEDMKRIAECVLEFLILKDSI